MSNTSSNPKTNTQPQPAGSQSSVNPGNSNHGSAQPAGSQSSVNPGNSNSGSAQPTGSQRRRPLLAFAHKLRRDWHFCGLTKSEFEEIRTEYFSQNAGMLKVLPFIVAFFAMAFAITCG